MTESATHRADAEVAARLEHVERSFGDLTVIEDLSLSIPANAITAIVGPNGSGKTTLARMVAGVLHPHAGERTLTTDVERPVGYLPQEPQFRPAFTVEETLTFYADFLESAVDIDATMKRVGLAGVSDRRVDALSGGMRRLLGLAQSLLGRPPVVVLDEPTSGLDPRMQQHLLDVVTDVAAEGTGVLLTTHDLSWASETDTVVVLNRGEIVAQDSPDEIMAKTESESLWDAFLALVGEDPIVQTGGRD